MHRRREFLGTLAVAGSVSIAGCSLTQDTFDRSASAAGVGLGALGETGFEHRENQEQLFQRSVTAFGQSRDLRLTNWLVTYGKGAGEFGPDGAQFQVFSTPSVTVAGSELNPFDEFGDGQLLGEATQGGDAELEEDSTRTVEVLGNNVTFTEYESRRQIGGESVAAYIHIGRFSNDGDLLTVIGTHPEVLDESENIYDLAAAVEHPFEFEE